MEQRNHHSAITVAFGVVLTLVIFLLGYNEANGTGITVLIFGADSSAVNCPPGIPAQPTQPKQAQALLIGEPCDDGPSTGETDLNAAAKTAAVSIGKDDAKAGGKGKVRAKGKGKGMGRGSGSGGVCTSAGGTGADTDIDVNAPRTFLHAYKGDIAASVFNNLHNPSSPAKWTFVLNGDQGWVPNHEYTVGAERDRGESKGQAAEEVEENGKEGLEAKRAEDAPEEGAAVPYSDPYLSQQCNSLYLTRTGSRGNQPNKCVAIARVPPHSQSPTHTSHRVGFTALLTNQYQADYSRDYSLVEERQLLAPLLQSLRSLSDTISKKVGPAVDPRTGARRSAIVMVANEGVMDLLLNWFCSAEAADIDTKNVVVFVGTQESVHVIENLGAHAVYDAALGSMPKKAAGGYLDNTFSRMMWFKTTSVYIMLRLGFHVLFQDVDLVWLKSPIPYLESLENTDVSFMDDGARTPRYTPYFVNSGFFFIRYNAKTLYFQEAFTKSAPSEIGYTHSHQSVLIRHLSEAAALWGLGIQLLSRDLFPSGQAYHERKPFIKKIVDRTFMPYVFHMCWTSNRVDKVKYFKEIGLWYLPTGEAATETDGARGARGAAGVKGGGGGGGVASRDFCVDPRRTLPWALAAQHAKHGAKELGPGHGQGEAWLQSKSLLNQCCVREQYFKLA